jgi:hypothetical protein
MPVPAAADAMVATPRPHPGRSREDKAQQSGLLTAGSFDDNLNPPFFRSFLGKLSQRRELGDLPGRLTGQRLLLSVRDGAGSPVGAARVAVSAAAGGHAAELLTCTDGRAVFLSSWDALPTDGDLTVTVTPPDGSAPVTQTVPRGSETWEVALPQAHGEMPRDLDLAIVLDTTGSMADELEYLKAEIKGIATAVQKKFPHVSQHYGLIVYRDVGDEYVTRRFDFTPSVEEFRNNLSAQSAAGGGDYPESMQRGLEEAVQLRWREGQRARVMFLLADAPPHNQHLAQAMAAADRLRKQGVAIYPVACSGYDDACELVMRGCALLTGGQFLFLTDDSGVGEAHGEPHIPFYRVQKLDQLMVRMIASELSGRRIEPEKDQVLRTVGKPIN